MNSEGAFHLRLKVAEKECCESQRTFPLLLLPERRRLARRASSGDTLINSLLRELRKPSSGFKAARVERRVVLFLSREVFPGAEINRILVPCRIYPALQRRLASEGGFAARGRPRWRVAPSPTSNIFLTRCWSAQLLFSIFANKTGSKNNQSRHFTLNRKLTEEINDDTPPRPIRWQTHPSVGDYVIATSSRRGRLMHEAALS